MRDVADELEAGAAGDPEKAFLLVDLSEVLWLLTSRARDQMPPLCSTVGDLIERLGKLPMNGGEEVLF